MMHLQMIGLACAIAIGSRLLAQIKPADASWQIRWQSALTAFVVPPLFLLATAIAIVAMGTNSIPRWEGGVSFAIAAGFVAAAATLWLQIIWLAIKTQRQMRQYPRRLICSAAGRGRRTQGRVVETSAVFSAQVGLWASELVVSRGLLEHLDAEHLEAVLAHESGHAHYRDTFWFFWLGGLRRLTCWLPQSETLWQELLLLREVRADEWAARRVDSLVLAESLMSVITAPLLNTETICASFSCAAPRSRLAQRVDALLAGAPALVKMPRWSLAAQWGAIALSLSPLTTIPFHH
ncbi:MAG: M56 family metallopeptidase [Phormidesmis sp.]